MSRHYQRREFLKLAGAAAMAQSLNGAEKLVSIGFVGVGKRGTGLVKILLDVPGVEIPAICDINEEHLKNAQDIIEKKGCKRPEGYSHGPKTIVAWQSGRIWMPS
jgi:myo-inositol 2-dehydrogenase / D-chiro-inositol 1-dehydrogenase